ncbi:50S ribosomal protein L10 [Candidatus Peregrinibacteria bacterium]|nr:50S ribosomal protein L10 [Candidatus Peregrinibacteria bacterium]
MPVTRKQKEETLAKLVDSFKKAKSVVFSQYQGTNVKGMRELRKKLREKKVAFKVAKKTLMTLAAKQIGFDQIPVDFMQGPIGLAFGMEDEIAPAKVLHEFGKDHETVKIVGAIFEGKLMPAADARVIAALPGREVLLAKLLGSMKAPIAGFHAVLHGLLRNFVYALAEVQKKKPA